MKYIIQEMQTNAAGVTAFVTPEQKNDKNQAESVYYSRCASAAISEVPVHTVTLETNEGFQMMAKCYRHGEEAGESE